MDVFLAGAHAFWIFSSRNGDAYEKECVRGASSDRELLISGITEGMHITRTWYSQPNIVCKKHFGLILTQKC